MEEDGKFGTKIDSFLSMFPKFYVCVLGAGDGCLMWQNDSSDIFWLYVELGWCAKWKYTINITNLLLFNKEQSNISKMMSKSFL